MATNRYGKKRLTPKELQQTKEKFKKFLGEKLKNLHASQKIALTLIDIQNDFTQKEFTLADETIKKGKLYVQGGENVVDANLAVLEALEEMCDGDQSIKAKVDILVTMDQHVPQRTDSPDRACFMNAFGETKYAELIQSEKDELKQFGPHCLTSEPGSDLAQKLQNKLDELSKKNLNIQYFGKIVFDATQAGLLLAEGMHLHQARKENPEQIYAKNNQSQPTKFVDILQQNNYVAIINTGICGEICVKEATLGMEKLFTEDKSQTAKPNIHLFEPAIHYLAIESQQKTAQEYENKSQENNLVTYLSDPIQGTYLLNYDLAKSALLTFSMAGALAVTFAAIAATSILLPPAGMFFLIAACTGLYMLHQRGAFDHTFMLFKSDKRSRVQATTTATVDAHVAAVTVTP